MCISTVIAHALGYLLFGLVIAAMITGVVVLLVDYRRWSRDFELHRRPCPHLGGGPHGVCSLCAVRR